MNKAVSIIIPAYNAEKFITKCLTSISDQTFTNYEIIVSNDGSTDNTLANVNEFISLHPNIDIKVLSNSNGGASLARRRALEIASGEWIAFVDADDTIPSNSLMDLYTLTDDSTDLIVGFLTPKDKVHFGTNKPDQWQSAVLQGHISPTIWAKLYRRNILKPSMLDIPKEITNGEDALMNIQYAFAMKRPPVFCFTHIYNYTRNPLSLSHSTKRDINYEYSYDRLRLRAIPNEKHEKFLYPITKYRINGILGCCRSDTIAVANKRHPFFEIIKDGMARCNYRASFFEWIALNVKNPYIIKYSGLLRAILISLRHRLSLLFPKR
ncbi:MAG: glycosyltransferase family 2 protein [Clostridium sp.]|nr:glycosyltransferase family 2 protein [Clostridium sp.]